MTTVTTAERAALSGFIPAMLVQHPDDPLLSVGVEDTVGLDRLCTIVERIITSRQVKIEALLPDDCWVTRSEIRCTNLVGGEFSNGAKYTEDLCCLPCKIRRVLSDQS